MKKRTVFERLEALAAQFNKSAENANEKRYKGTPFEALHDVSVSRASQIDYKGEELELTVVCVDFTFWRFSNELRRLEAIELFRKRVEKMGLSLVGDGDGDGDDGPIECFQVLI